VILERKFEKSYHGSILPFRKYHTLNLDLIIEEAGQQKFNIFHNVSSTGTLDVTFTEWNMEGQMYPN
jgi:hypothetical protein